MAARDLFRILCGLVALCTLTACAAVPSERQVKQFLGIERPFAHNDVPAPPTPAAFVLQFGMGQTQRIRIHGQQNAVVGDVTDPQAVQAILGVLRTGAATSFAGGTETQQTPLHLDFLIDAPERQVTVSYNPASQTLQMYNVPTPAWPDHAVASYATTPAFGAALQHAVASAQSSSMP